MRGFARFALTALTCFVLAPAAANAQGSITGVVKDTSGAVLPGVTVEAASPALIEKTRSVVTDGTGQYRIENLRPGSYSVTFTLAGFNTVKREGIELTGNFTASVNADLRVGALEETITVTGETPIVDVQTTNRQQVLNQDLVDSLPANRVPGLLGANPAYRPGEPLPEISALGTTLDVASWGFRKSVRPNAAGVQELELDPAVLARARRDLGDLRLMSDDRQIPFVVEHSSLTRTIAVSATAVSDPKHPAMSRWRLVLPYPHLPLIRLTVAVSTPLFQREVRLWEEITDDRGYTNRRWLGQASWSQTPGRRVNVFSIGLNQHPETETLWLETDNGDNPPIRLGEVLAHHGVTRLLFQVGIDVPIALYYGQARVAAPRYDLGLVGAQLLEADKSAPGLDPEVALKEPSFIQSVVLGGRAAILFWGMLAVVVVVLLAVIARLLPKAPPAAGGGTSD